MSKPRARIIDIDPSFGGDPPPSGKVWSSQEMVTLMTDRGRPTGVTPEHLRAITFAHLATFSGSKRAAAISDMVRRHIPIEVRLDPARLQAMYRERTALGGDPKATSLTTVVPEDNEYAVEVEIGAEWTPLPADQALVIYMRMQESADLGGPWHRMILVDNEFGGKRPQPELNPAMSPALLEFRCEGDKRPALFDHRGELLMDARGKIRFVEAAAPDEAV